MLKKMAEFIFSYRIFDDCLAVISECPIMAEHIHQFLKSLAVSDTIHGTPAVRLAIFRAPGNRVALCCPEVGLAEVEPVRREAWFRFRRLFAHLAINCVPGHYMLHASGVVDGNGDAALISGESGSGKTTVLAALLRRGYRFLCDDYAPIRYDDATLKAMPVGATVSEKSFALLPELASLKRDSCRFYFERQWQWTVNFGEKYETVPAETHAKISKLIFLTPNFGQASAMADCDPGETSLRLIDGRLPGPRHTDLCRERKVDHAPDRRFELARHVSQRARSYVIANGDLEHTVDLIASAIGS